MLSLPLRFYLQFLKPFSRTLRLVTASNAPPSTYYRSCWHVVSPGFSFGSMSFCSPLDRLYSFPSLHDFINLSSPQNPGSSSRLLTNILHCCQRQGIFHPLCDWSIFQSSYEYSATLSCNTYSSSNLYRSVSNFSVT